ncbi:MAG: hypothetical protein GWO11_09120 [Desulfuromonadales bacterium]|nr:hypothetical protein [Desulfuromonadales bacterium]NIS42981.1 hypothetical protein [Desulfuromonadales bacterium]
MLRLGRLCERRDLEERAERFLSAHAEQFGRHPSAYAQSLIALDYALGEKSELVLCPGENGQSSDSMRDEVAGHFEPNLMIAECRPGNRQLAELLPLVEGKAARRDRTTAYLCRGQSCREPVTDREALARQLEEGRR